MLFRLPALDARLTARIAELDEARRLLGRQVGQASPWSGELRRTMRADAAHSSVSIEGFSVPVEQLRSVAAGHADERDRDQQAVAHYARAIDHVAAMAEDPGFAWSTRAILDLHFDCCAFQREHRPGRWRQGPIAVTAPEGGLAYQAPPADEVPALMDEVVAWLEEGDLDAPTVVRAAMAHLHVVSVHPFADGNGRVSRIVQSLALARDGLLAPEVGSIEEYLGRHTGDYYAALRAAQGGRYQPQRDATPWVAFCVEAHLEEAHRRLRLIDEASRRWQILERLARRRAWPDRLVIALEQSAFGPVDRRGYAAEADVSTATASGDLRRLADAGLLDPHGSGRGAHYRASAQLRSAIDDG
ncbi:Fic family protein [Patulibacter defluvii]|uniref:Fic family protein n=1 Tax=Patulibacter defluvii TaxID=3095358 RepID=UPI002A75A4B6|nr:Fic family protein [Patulibacter sp. DM4]